MSEQTIEFSTYIEAFKRRLLGILIIALTVFGIGAVIAWWLPPTYQSSATILIKEQDIPPDLVRSTVTSFASQRIQAISQEVMARPNLLEIIKKYDLYKGDKTRLTSEEIVRQMRENIGLEMIDARVIDPRTGSPQSATIAFRLSFSGENAGKVQKVANELMSLYLKENLRERTDQARETYDFLAAESRHLLEEIVKYEQQLTAFKEEHAQVLPELAAVNQQLLSRTEDELARSEQQIEAINERKLFLQAQLSQIKPYATQEGLDPFERVQMLKARYLQLTARYSADHPDVIRLKNEIQSLEAETGIVDSSLEQLQELESLRAQLAELRQQYSAQHPDVVSLEQQISALEAATLTASEPKSASELAEAAYGNPNNPAYIELQNQIAAADAQTRIIRQEQVRLKNKLADYEQRLTQTPQVASEYRTLTRGLGQTLDKYRDINTKLRQAEIGLALEKDSKGERFVIIEQPILAEKPISPNRPAILILSLVLALGAGVGYAAALESFDDSVRGGKSISAALGAAPLAIIPYWENNTDISKRKRKLTARTAAAVGVLILAIAMLHFFWSPLDVLWYKALRKADIVINA